MYICVYLQCDDVRGHVQEFLHDDGFAVVPDQGPGRAVAILLPRGVFVTQHVVRHH